jgi:hypothetical protein
MSVPRIRAGIKIVLPCRIFTPAIFTPDISIQAHLSEQSNFAMNVPRIQDSGEHFLLTAV